VQAKELENSLVLLCRNSIIHIICNQNKNQTAVKTATAASIATNATSNISNISLISTATASDSMTSSLIYANKITVCSKSTPPSFGISNSSFPLSNDKLRACLNFNCFSNQMSISCSHSANKITTSFEIDLLIGLLTNYTLINRYGQHFCPVF
jgi:hypothetical protein